MDSFMGWIGGKRTLRKAILERFPKDKVERYIEVFGGAAWVLFAKERQAGQLEVYNDINGNLVNLRMGRAKAEMENAGNAVANDWIMETMETENAEIDE